jgi:hypothetical protein
MSGAGIKGFSTSGEMYLITFVLLAPVPKAEQTVKVTLTSPRDRQIDLSGRFCKECGTKAADEMVKNCRQCGSVLPAATRYCAQCKVILLSISTILFSNSFVLLYLFIYLLI